MVLYKQDKNIGGVKYERLAKKTNYYYGDL